MFRCRKIVIALALAMAIPVAGSAQTADKAPAPGGSAQPASQSPPSAELLKPEQLEALVAPIALYPDELVANVLAASTYPLEVVQADRWLKERKSLKGDALKTEVDKQSWDDSVKALASTADVLTMMSDKIEWTKNLGDAVLAQQPDVMDAIQRLRTKAYDNKKLVTTKQQKVSVQTQENKQVVVIEPAAARDDVRAVLRTGDRLRRLAVCRISAVLFRVPVLYRRGGRCGRSRLWHRLGDRALGQLLGRRLQLGQPQRLCQPSHHQHRNGWQHNAVHRQGVRYNNVNVQQRFGNNNLKAGASNRMDFRGRDGQQVLRPNQGARRSCRRPRRRSRW